MGAGKALRIERINLSGISCSATPKHISRESP